MATLNELGKAVHVRRSEIGLTQAALAKLSGLTRQTINQIENGTIGDLSVKRAERLASAVGITLHVAPPHSRQVVGSGRTSAIARAARTASVSYRATLTEDHLRGILLGASFASTWVPHLHALLDEAPMTLLADVVEQLHHESEITRAAAWQQLRDLARSLKSRREIWW